MQQLGILVSLVFLVLGIIGGMTAISRFMRGYSGFFIFSPIGGALYLAALLVLAPLFTYFMRNMDDSVKLLLFITAPFAFFGHVLWAMGFVLQMGSALVSPTQLPIEQTFDVGDGLMLRGKHAEAEQMFRQALAAEPFNVKAQLRVVSAMERSGRLEEAADELFRAHQKAIAEQGHPTLKKEEHQQRILSLTFALGDILSMKLDDPPRALALYRKTLSALAGFDDADVLRDRLLALEHPDRMSLADAVEKLQPLKIKL
jgi:tetratricopeptide (TPR) repeat protein